MSGTLPHVMKTGVLLVPIQLAVDDWLNTHGKGLRSYTLEESPHVLRQPHLPEDARIAYAYLDQDDSVRENALEEMREMVNRVLEILPSEIPEGSEDDLALSRLVNLRNEALRVTQTLTNALNTPPVRHIVVGIESDEFAPVERGEEPIYPFLPEHFSPVKKGKG